MRISRLHDSRRSADVQRGKGVGAHWLFLGWSWVGPGTSWMAMGFGLVICHGCFGGSRVVMDRSRFVRLGRWFGFVTVRFGHGFDNGSVRFRLAPGAATSSVSPGKSPCRPRRRRSRAKPHAISSRLSSKNCLLPQVLRRPGNADASSIARGTVQTIRGIR